MPNSAQSADSSAAGVALEVGHGDDERLAFGDQRCVSRRVDGGLERDGALILVDDERLPMRPGETPQLRRIRFRTLGCYPSSGAIESAADRLEAVIAEMLVARQSERQGRLIDGDAGASMEQKKQEGYF